MYHLSEGWPSRYDPDKQTRRADQKYAEFAERYATTGERVGGIRNQLLQLAAEAKMEPPLTRYDIRRGSRGDEIVRSLGDIGVKLLAEHKTAHAENRQAMDTLRDQACRLWEESRIANEQEL